MRAHFRARVRAFGRASRARKKLKATRAAHRGARASSSPKVALERASDANNGDVKRTQSVMVTSSDGASFALAGGLAFGYDVALVGGVLPTLAARLALDDVERGVVVSATKFGATFGAFIGAAAMRAHGRVRGAIWIGAFAFALGAATSAVGATTSVLTLIIGRIIVGLGVGALAVIVPAYCGEVTRAIDRGRVVALYELSTCVGMIVANAATWVEPRETYVWILASPALIGIVCVIVFSRCAESARWCVRAGDGTRARESLRRELNAEDVEAEARAMESEERANGASDRGVTMTQALMDVARNGWRELVDGDERRAMRLVLALAWFNQMSASTSVINYSSRILRDVSSTSEDWSTSSVDMFNVYAGLIVVFKTLGVLTSLTLVDELGRRPLLIYGSAFSAVGLTIASVGYGVSSVLLTLVGLCAFIFAFSCSSASVFWVIVSEFFSMRAKSAASAVVTSSLFFAGFVCDLIFAPMLSALNAGAFALFALVCVAETIFVYAYVPETRRKSFQDIQRALKSDRVEGGDDDAFVPVYQSVSSSSKGVELASLRAPDDPGSSSARV